MNVSDLFSVSLAFGFVLSLVSFLSGSLHIGHVHPHLPHGGAHIHAGGGSKGGAGKFNFGTFAAFLVWFGGTGYILMNFTTLQLLLVVFTASVAGTFGGVIVYLFVARVLARNDRPLDPEDYRITGMLGTVSSPVLTGGTGEMIGVQQGRRVGVPIRSETGDPIPAGKEVVVTRYEHGIAFVREWDELTSFGN